MHFKFDKIYRQIILTQESSAGLSVLWHLTLLHNLCILGVFYKKNLVLYSDHAVSVSIVCTGYNMYKSVDCLLSSLHCQFI